MLKMEDKITHKIVDELEEKKNYIDNLNDYGGEKDDYFPQRIE